MSFDWSGVGTPGAQLFTIYDPITFDVLESGLTRMASVPSPGTLFLMGVGAICLLLTRGTSSWRSG